MTDAPRGPTTEELRARVLAQSAAAEPWRCELGHTRRAMECPACGEKATGQVARLEHWRWYKQRTSSPRIRALITARLDKEKGERLGSPTGDERPADYT